MNETDVTAPALAGIQSAVNVLMDQRDTIDRSLIKLVAAAAALNSDYDLFAGGSVPELFRASTNGATAVGDGLTDEEREEKERRERVIADAALALSRDKDAKMNRIRMYLSKDKAVPISLLVNRTGFPQDQVFELLKDMPDVHQSPGGYSFAEAAPAAPPVQTAQPAQEPKPAEKPKPARPAKTYGITKASKPLSEMKRQKREREKRMEMIVLWINDQPNKRGVAKDCATELELDFGRVGGDFRELADRGVIVRDGREYSKEMKKKRAGKTGLELKKMGGKPADAYKLFSEPDAESKEVIEAGKA